MSDVKEKVNGAKVSAKVKESSSGAKSESGSQGAQGSEKPMPTREQVGQWCKQDLESALYFLDYIRSRPEIMKMVEDALYEDALRGPKIP